MKTKLYCLHRRIGQKNLRTEKDFRKAKAKKLKKLTIILIIKSTLVDLRIVWSWIGLKWVGSWHNAAIWWGNGNPYSISISIAGVSPLVRRYNLYRDTTCTEIQLCLYWDTTCTGIQLVRGYNSVQSLYGDTSIALTRIHQQYTA